MRYLSPEVGNWRMVQLQGQPTQASGPSNVSGPSTAQAIIPQTYAAPSQTQQAGGQTLEELMKLQQQQQTMPLGQNYLRQFMTPASTNYFQQLY